MYFPGHEIPFKVFVQKMGQYLLSLYKNVSRFVGKRDAHLLIKSLAEIVLFQYNNKKKAGFCYVGRCEMEKKIIVSDPKVMMGKPIIAGTRITVELILEKLAVGETVDQILDAHPRLTREAIQAALAFAAESLKADVIYPTTETGT